jgi:hypothetical protein
MNREFVERIEEPRTLQLQMLRDDARSEVERRLERCRMSGVPERVLQKMTYAYYHDWNANDPSCVFLLEEPGKLGEYRVFETNAYVELGEDFDIREAIRVDQRFGARWLAKSRYANFTQEFVKVCREHELVTSDRPWWQYVLSGEFFDDFYMTDVIKYRSVSPATADIGASFTEFLIHELEYIEPELVFAFGGRAWNALRDRLSLEPISGELEATSVHDRHGVLHETNRLVGTMVLPLGHPSPKFRGAQLSHEQYMQRLASGVRVWDDQT